MNPRTPEPSRALSLDDIFTHKVFDTRTLRDPHWMADGRRLSFLEAAPGSKRPGLFVLDVATGARERYASPTDLHPPSARGASRPELSGYQWSPDESRVLLAGAPGRRAPKGVEALWVYTPGTGLTLVAGEGPEYRCAKWSPCGSGIGYVRRNDVYVRALGGEEIQVSRTGSAARYNGRLGWVYEEELDLVDGWSFSPDGRWIAWLETDESTVPIMHLPNFEAMHGEPETMRYPKAGDPNPVVNIFVSPNPLAGAMARPRRIRIPKGVAADYVARLQWTPGSRLLVQVMPRSQRRLDFVLLSPASGRGSVVATDTDSRWVETHGDATFCSRGRAFLFLSERSGFRHVWKCTLSSRRVTQVTHGEWDVTSLAGVDERRGRVMACGARPALRDRQVFSAGVRGGRFRRLTNTPGVHECSQVSSAGYWLHTRSLRGTAPVVEVSDSAGRVVRVLVRNPARRLRPFARGSYEPLDVEASDGSPIHIELVKPANWSADRKWPVLVTFYGGPASQAGTNGWGGGHGWHHYLAQEGFVVATVDGRGTDGRGADYRKVTHLRLGEWETHDLIEAARRLGELDWVDETRIGAWGWSYGGYLAALCILRGGGVFRTAVAAAPVTSWRYYDSIYTERYMGLPSENPAGYEATAPEREAAHLAGSLLLVHGLSDDNVHYQNSARLSYELQRLGKPFETMVYPGKHHGIEGVSLHVYAHMTDFLRRTL